jgi:hypothetical protein
MPSYKKYSVRKHKSRKSYHKKSHKKSPKKSYKKSPNKSYKKSHKKSYKKSPKKSHKKSPKSYHKKSYKKSPKSYHKKSHKKSYKSSHKKRRVKSHYRMRGMGGMLTMFGGAIEQVELDYQSKRDMFLQAKKNYEEENDRDERKKLRQVMKSAKISMDKSKEKMRTILKGVGEATSKAASQLNKSNKMSGSGLTSGLKSIGTKLSSGIKSIGSKLSSGIKSVGSNVKDKYKKYKEGQELIKWNKLNEKYGRPSSSMSSSMSSESKSRA